MTIERLIGRLCALEAELLVAERPMEYIRAVVLLRDWWHRRADEILRAPACVRADLHVAALQHARRVGLPVPAPGDEPAEMEMQLAAWAQRVVLYYRGRRHAYDQPSSYDRGARGARSGRSRPRSRSKRRNTHPAS